MYQISVNNKKGDMKVTDRQRDKLRQVFTKKKKKYAKNGLLKGIRQELILKWVPLLFFPERTKKYIFTQDASTVFMAHSFSFREKE